MRYNRKEEPINAHTCEYTAKLINCNCLKIEVRPKLANIMHKKYRKNIAISSDIPIFF